MTGGRRHWLRRLFERRPAPPYCPVCHDQVSVFRSAVTGVDGTIDPGYLGMYVVVVLVLGAIPSSICLAIVAMVLDVTHRPDLMGIAAVIGACGGCFGAAAAGVGVFRAGDKHDVQPSITANVSASGNIAVSSTPPGG